METGLESCSMPTPALSIIICTYQREETLRQTISDILDQSFERYELIVVDQSISHDSETDNFLLSHSETLRLIRVDVPNLPNARNRGIEAARAGLILFVDDDIRLSPQVVGRLVEHFENPDVDVIAPLVCDDRGEQAAADDYSRRYGELITTPNGRLWEADTVIGACMAIRRPVVDDVGKFDLNLGRLHPSASGEDYEFFARVRAKAYRIFVDPSIKVIHLGKTPGGCGVRSGDPIESWRSQMRALAYIKHKQRRALNGSWWWISLSMMGHWASRNTFRVGLSDMYRRLRDIHHAVIYVRNFLKLESNS